MWQTRNLITIVLVLIVVALVVINTVQLRPMEWRRRDATSSGQTTTTTTTGGGAPNNKPASEGRGQPESFSSESTGLGDLEGADSLKKMLKRASWPATGRSPGAHRRPMTSNSGHTGKPTAMRRAIQPYKFRGGPDQSRSSPIKLISSMNRVLISSGRRAQDKDKDDDVDVDDDENEDHDSQEAPGGGPIQVSRRTVERLLEEFGQASEGQADSNDHHDDDDGAHTTGVPPASMEGDLSSRVSLLTMRKAPESEEGLLMKPVAPVMFGVERQRQISWQPVDGAGWPLLASRLAADDDGQTTRISADQNYLPRIARAAFM